MNHAATDVDAGGYNDAGRTRIGGTASDRHARAVVGPVEIAGGYGMRWTKH